MSQQYSTLPTFRLKSVREKSLRYPVPKCATEAQAALALKHAYSILHAALHDKECEHLVVLLLDAQHNYLGLSTVAIGGMSGLQCGVRDVFKAAITHRAHAIILGHNHPSGDTTPSQQDGIFTDRVLRAGILLDVPLLDHIIISSGSKDGSYSFFNHGRLG